MGVLNHSQLPAYLKQAKAEAFSPVYLIHGDELLCKRALTALLDAMLPEGMRDHRCEPVDGSEGREIEAVERVRTYSLLGGMKVVVLLDSVAFYSQVDMQGILAKIREAHQAEDLKKASTHLLALLSRKNLSFEDLDPQNRSKALGPAAPDADEGPWLDDVIDFCRNQRYPVAPPTDGARLIQSAVEEGLAKGNHLVMTTDRVDRRHGLYKAIATSGQIVDCSLPTGDRKADRDLQQAALQEQARLLTAAAGKNIEPGAMRTLVELTGVNLRTFSNQLEKLISYVGRRKVITDEDVNAALERTRTDPIYAFTNAVTDRHPEAALFYLNTMLDAATIDHPLQLLAAMINQFRRLIMLRDFLDGPGGELWQPGCSYPVFQSRVLPAIAEYDRQLTETLDSWQSATKPTGSQKTSGTAKKAVKKKAPWGADLVISGPGKSPYPVYLMLNKAHAFSRKRLTEILDHLLHADRRLKSATANPRIALEEAVLFVCRAK